MIQLRCASSIRLRGRTMVLRPYRWLIFGALASALAGCHSKAGPPYSAKESLNKIAIEKGFRNELFANEPLISSPVAMEFD